MGPPSTATRPIRETIRELAIAIAEGQSELDQSVLDIQRELTEKYEGGEIDRQLLAQQFRFADVELDLRLVVTRSMEPQKRPDESRARAHFPKLNATLLSPASRQRDAIERELVSTVSARIVPVPPERPDHE